mgnify:CR=1 FL=1
MDILYKEYIIYIESFIEIYRYVIYIQPHVYKIMFFMSVPLFMHPLNIWHQPSQVKIEFVILEMHFTSSP